MIVAHRGASHDAPENTIAAFNLAWRQGADAVEGDFQLTADGRIVCIHDKDTGRVADKRLVVGDSTWPELRRLDVGAYRGDEFRGERIPAIAEVLSAVPAGKRIYIEIKSGAEIIPKMIREIENSSLQTEQIVVISFDADVIRSLKSAAPQFMAFWLRRIRKEAGKMTPALEEALETLKEIRADGLSTHWAVIDKPFVQGLIQHGRQHHVWTVNDPDVARRFREWGSSSITTAAPGEMIRSLLP